MRLNWFLIVFTLSAAAAVPPELPKDPEVGVYVTDGSEWREAPVEIVNWKSGGAVRRVLNEPGEVNGWIRGGASPMAFPKDARIEVLIRTDEKAGIGNYRLHRLRSRADAREFKSESSGTFDFSASSTQDLVPFKAERAGLSLWRMELSGLPDGHYGFVPSVSSASLASSGRIYSFEIGNCGRCGTGKAASGNAAIHNAIRNLFRKDPTFSF